MLASVVIGTRQLWYFLNVPISLPNSGSRCFLFLFLQSNKKNPFHSCASFSIGFFYLILQRVRPLIYSVDIASKPEHCTRNVDSPIFRRTAVNSTDNFPVPCDTSELRHKHATEYYHTGCLILRRVTHNFFLQEH